MIDSTKVKATLTSTITNAQQELKGLITTLVTGGASAAEVSSVTMLAQIGLQLAILESHHSRIADALEHLVNLQEAQNIKENLHDHQSN